MVLTNTVELDKHRLRILTSVLTELKTVLSCSSDKRVRNRGDSPLTIYQASVTRSKFAGIHVQILW